MYCASARDTVAVYGWMCSSAARAGAAPASRSSATENPVARIRTGPPLRSWNRARYAILIGLHGITRGDWSTGLARRPIRGTPDALLRLRTYRRGMLSRLALTTVGLILIAAPAASAKAISVRVPAEGQVAVAFAGGAKSVKVKSAPAGLTVSGGVKKGRLAVAVVRPRGVAASGNVVLTVAGKPKGVKRVASALDGGTAPAGCG